MAILGTGTNRGGQDLGTSTGLLNLAKQKGLEQKAQAKISQGEDPKRIFSGGFIQDVFDVLNAPQSIVAGIAKGQNPIEAIQTRASFSDNELLGKYGAMGKIGGIIADIATDPLMLIPPLGIGKRIFQGIKGGAKLLAETKMGEPVANFLGKRFVYRFGQDPAYAKLAEDAITIINKGSRKVFALAKPITELTKPEQVLIATARKAGDLSSLPKNLLDKAKPAFDELDRLSKEAIDNLPLSKGLREAYEANIGKYIKRTYKIFEAPTEALKKEARVFPSKPIRVEGSLLKGRKDVPEELRNAWGEILEAGYPTTKALLQLNQGVERAKFFSTIATKWGKDIAEEGMKQLPKAETLGKLAGKFVPEAIYDDIQEIFKAKEYGEKLAGKIVQGFKFGKVILNPATHVRNVISNFVLNNFGGLPLVRMPEYAAKASLAIGKKGKYFKEIDELGVTASTFWGNELRALLVNASDPAIKRIPKEIANKLGDLYQKEEEFAKTMMYIFQREKGLNPVDAWKMAEEATFNYAQAVYQKDEGKYIWNAIHHIHLQGDSFGCENID